MNDNPQIGKYVKLLKGLAEATVSGRLEWEETVEEGTFRVFTEHAMIHLASRVDPKDGGPYFTLTLLDKRGRVADVHLVRRGILMLPNEEFVLAERLYESARRQALHAEDLLDRAIVDVESLA
jgi:hypothetical protein